MIQNPNVFVRNFNELSFPLDTQKNGKLISGLITESHIFSYNGIIQKYAIIRIDVTTPGTSFVTMYQTRYTDKTPVLRDLKNRQEVGRVYLSEVGTYLLYSDIYMVENFKVEISTSAADTEADVYITFTDTLPEIDIPTVSLLYKNNNIRREGIIFSGNLNMEQTFAYSDIQQRYLYLRLDVTTAGNGYVETYVTKFADKFPVLHDLKNKKEIDRNIFKTVGTYHLYADLYLANTFKLHFGVGDGNCNITASLAFCEELPDIIEESETLTTITKKQYLVSQDANNGAVCNIKNNVMSENTLEYIVFDRSKRWLVLQCLSDAVIKGYFGVYSNSGTKMYPKFYNEQGDSLLVNGNTPFTINIGSTTLFYDLGTVTDFKDGLYLQLGNNNPENYCCTIKYVCQTNDISRYVKPITIVSNNGKYSIEKTLTINSCWYDYSVQHSASSGLIKLRKGNESVILDLNSLKGIKAGNQGETHLIPFDINLKNNSHGNIGLVIRESENVGKYWFCDVTNIDNALVADNWIPVKFWEKIETNRKILTKDSGSGSKFRYDTTLPDSFYGKENLNGSLIEYQGFPQMRTLGPLAISKKMAVCAQYDTDGHRCNVWATTDGGQNWVSQYDFRTIYSRIADKTLVPKINTSMFPSYDNGLTLKKISFNIPTNDNKEPEHLLSLTDISFTSISSASECVVSAVAHGLSTGDVVCFIGNSDSEWNQLTNNAISEDKMGDNIYFVETIDKDSFYLRYYNGSYDSILPCRHIHSVSEIQDGFLIATGETHPEGWIMMLQQRAKDEAASINVLTQTFPIFRLNSSETGVQRACGLLLTETKQPDLIFFSDDSHILKDNYLDIEGRTSGLPSITSNGIWRGKLSDIDNLLKFERILDIPEPLIWVYRLGNMVIGYAQLGGLVVSADCGKTWDYIQITDKNISLFNGINKGHICFGGGYVLKEIQ